MVKALFKNKYLSIVIGTAILAFGMFNIHSRCDISEGGVLGLTLLLHHWLGISPGIFSLVIDGTFYCVGIMFFGKRFLSDSLLAAACYSGWFLLFEAFGPVIPSLNDHLLTAALLGAVFVGVGAGLIVMHNVASGGDDALALILNMKFGFGIKYIYIFFDAVVLLLSLSYIPLRSIVYSLISVILSGFIIDRIHSLKN